MARRGRLAMATVKFIAGRIFTRSFTETYTARNSERERVQRVNRHVILLHLLPATFFFIIIFLSASLARHAIHYTADEKPWQILKETTEEKVKSRLFLRSRSL